MADTATAPTSTSEETFAKALAAENAGDNIKAEQFLKLAVIKDKRERGLPI